MQLRRHLLKITSLVVLLFSTVSLPASAADLLDIYRLALRNDPSFEVARYSLQAVQQKNPQALAALLPSVSITGSNNLTRGQSQFSNSASINRYVHGWNWSLQLTQPLIRLQSFYAYGEAQYLVAQANAQFSNAQQELILRTLQAYFGVLASREGIRVAEAEIAAAAEQLSLAQSGFDKGLGTITDVREGQSRVDLARAHLVNAQNEVDAKNAELAKIIDEVPVQLSMLDVAAFIPMPEPNNQQYWIGLARDRNPAVKAAEAALQANETIVGKARAEHAPTLDLVSSYGENYSSGSLTLPTDFSTKGQTKQIGIQFTVPLFSGGATNARVAESIANQYRAGAEFEVARRQAATNARLAFAGVVNGIAQIAALESAEVSGLSMVKQSHSGYKQGIYNNSKVLDAEQQYYTAKRDLIKARYETLFQALKLKAAAGQLTEADLISVNTFFVPQPN